MDILNAKKKMYKDASASPVSSPVSAGTDLITLTWPADASALIVRTQTAAIRVANESNAANGYYLIAAGPDFPMTGNAGDVIYFIRPNSTDLSFCFIG
jgi:hypothetical protein